PLPFGAAGTMRATRGPDELREVQRGRERQCQERVATVHISRARVERTRRMRRVARLDLQHAQLALDGSRARCFEQRGARTTSSCCGTDVQVVDEASASAILHAEGDGE